MKQLAIQFSKKAYMQLECLALRRDQEPVECIRNALTCLSTVIGLVDKNGILTVHAKGQIFKFDF